MMKGTFRVLTIRRHKLTNFVDSFDCNFSHIQLMFENSLTSASINPGDLVSIIYEVIINRRGVEVYHVLEICDIIKNEISHLFKSEINNQDVDIAAECLFNSINGGRNLNLWRYKYEFAERIRCFFLNKGFVHVYTSPFMNERGTSIVEPYKCCSKFENDKYLKITHELGLKKTYYITLRPVFEIGVLARDVYSTKNGVNEFLSLEFVAPVGYIDMRECSQQILEIAKNLAKEYNMQYNSAFDDIHISHNHYEGEDEGVSSTMYQELYTDSPLAKVATDGYKYEFKWKFGAKTIAHGYTDENDYDKINRFFDLQLRYLYENGIEAEKNKDYLSILSLSSPASESYNFGIDRFLYFFFGLKSSYESNNMLGI